MKILLFTDTLDNKTLIEKLAQDVPSVQARVELCTENTTVEQLESWMKEEIYFLILPIVKSDFFGNYINKKDFVNAVNCYTSNNEIQRLKQKFEEDKHLNLPSIVNKTTAYFNVFLPIQKGVSFSGNRQESNLARVDTINEVNYKLAFVCSKLNKPYYILNYAEAIFQEVVLDILKKLD